MFLIAQRQETGKKLQALLTSEGLTVSLAMVKDKLAERLVHELPQIIVVETNGASGRDAIHEVTHSSAVRTSIPVLALVKADSLDHPEDYAGIDDFSVWPGNEKELALRIRRLLRRDKSPEETIVANNLVIDLADCEVRVKGKVIELTFKEYELLKFLATNRGRVFSREALLNKVWGYDYFGGDRTVDVHIRRLRSKIENDDESYIETVRNIGYRFSKSAANR